ncbi:hypothetical protein, partial [Pantoea ananatis]|uniref:hypothetical protein n=1 Tax=Pantoea ananas TaxID=553 RepID=UPI001C930193
QDENLTGSRCQEKRSLVGLRAPVKMPVESENQFEYPCQGQQSHDKNNGDNPQNYFHFLSLTIKKHSHNSIGKIQRCAFCLLPSQL